MKFSIIIPVYNAELHIERCLSSICKAIKHANAECEVICVDDCSKDNSLRVLQSFAIPELIVHHLDAHAGVGAARNKALEIAKGDWILFVDADDYVEDNYIVAIEKTIAENPDAQIVNFGSNSPYGDYLYASLWAKAYRRDILPKRGFAKYAHGEDRLYLAEAIGNASKIIRIEDSLYCYQPHKDSATAAKRDLSWIRETINCNLEMLHLSRGAIRTFPSRYFHDIAVWILEVCAVEISRLPVNDCVVAESEWRMILPKIFRCSRFSWWHRFVAYMSFLFANPFVLCLCRLPYKLKQALKS